MEAVEAAFTAFYAYLTESEHFSAYFHSQAQIDQLIEKQKQSFITSLALDEVAFATHYQWLGRFHAEIGVTIEDLIAGLKIIRTELLARTVLPAEQLYDFIEHAETYLAHGYFDYELETMLRHAELVLKNAPASMPEELGYVVKWFITLGETWRGRKDSATAFEKTDDCPFTETINRYVPDNSERALLHREHRMQHVMAQRCHHFLQEKDYLLANFLLVRLFSISVGLFNRLLSATSLEQLEQAKRDPLTGLRMRHDLDKLLFHVRKKSRAQRQGFGVLMLDLDYFKKINDTFGHDMGDAVLKSVSALLQKLVREEDVVIRYGGEEILIFLPMMTAEVLSRIAERIRQKISQERIVLDDKALQVTVSIGCLFVPYDCLDIPDVDLLKQVDENLYRAKRSGRNQVVCSVATSSLHKGN